MKTRLAALLCSLLFLSTLHAEEVSLITPTARVGTMIDLAGYKRWGHVNAGVQGSIFTLGTRLERVMGIASVETSIIPQYLKVQVLGYYFYHLGSDYGYYHRLRYHVGVGGDLYYNPTSITWSARYESTYTLPSTTPYNRIRPRVRCNFRIGSSQWQPFAEAEFFLALNGKNAGRADRMWYNAGVSYTIDRTKKIELRVREEQTWLTSPKQWNTYIGFAYKVSL